MRTRQKRGARWIGFVRGMPAAMLGALAAFAALAGAAAGDRKDDVPVKSAVAPTPQPPPAPPTPPAGTPKRLEPRDALVVGYRRALQALLQDDRSSAINAIIDVERSAAGKQTRGDVARITRAGQELDAQLAQADSESLVPVITLRHDLTQEYRKLRNPFLHELAGAMTVSTAELYATIGGADHAAALAATALASLAADAQRHGELPLARDLFERTLRLDADNVPALLGLGAQWELLGRYDLAVAAFSRARSARADDPEAALRLGVNLARLGRLEHGIEALAACRSRTVPEWVHVVAGEELARALAAAGRRGEAIAELEETIRRFPRQRGPYAQLAFLLDAERKQREARATLAALDEVPPSGEPSPRLRYCSWPTEALDASRATLARAARERLPALGRALARLEASGA